MKKMLLVLAGMACLGALASCKNDAEEVTIRYADDMFSSSDCRYEYAGSASGTVVYAGSSSYSVEFDPNSLAMLRYEEDDDVKSNMKTYQLTVPVVVTESYSSVSESQKSSVEIYLTKVGGEYYASDRNYSLGVKIPLSGSPEGSEFTLAGLVSSGSFVFSSITFRRK